MAQFQIDEGTFRTLLRIDDRYYVVISRTTTFFDDTAQLSIAVYPITDGEIWDDPYDTFVVDEARIIELEQEMKE